MENTVNEYLLNYDEEKALYPTDHRLLPLKTQVDKRLIIKFHPDKEIFQFKHEPRKRRYHQNFDSSKEHFENLEKSTGTSKTNTVHNALYKSTINTIVGTTQTYKRLHDIPNLFSEPVYINDFVGQSQPNEVLVIWGPRCMWLQSCIGKRFIEPYRIEGIPANVDIMALKQAIAQQKLCWHVINSNYVRAYVRLLGGGKKHDLQRRRLSIGDTVLNRKQFELNRKILQDLYQITSTNIESYDNLSQKFSEKINDGGKFPQPVSSGRDYLILARALYLHKKKRVDFATTLEIIIRENKITSKPIYINFNKRKALTAYDSTHRRYSWNDVSERLNKLAKEIRKHYYRKHSIEEKKLTSRQKRILGHRLLAIGILQLVFNNTNSQFLTFLSDDVLQKFVDTVHEFLSLSLAIETSRLLVALPIWLIDVISIARSDRLPDGQPLTFFNMFTYVIENEDGKVNEFYIPITERYYYGYIVLPNEEKISYEGKISNYDVKQNQRGLHIATCSNQFKIIKNLYGKAREDLVVENVFRNIRQLQQNESRQELHFDRLDYIGGILASNSVARFFEVASITEEDVNDKKDQFIFILDKLFRGKNIPLIMLVYVSKPQELIDNVETRPIISFTESISKLQIDPSEIPKLYGCTFEKFAILSPSDEECYCNNWKDNKILLKKRTNEKDLPDFKPWGYEINKTSTRSYYDSKEIVIRLSYQELQNLLKKQDKDDTPVSTQKTTLIKTLMSKWKIKLRKKNKLWLNCDEDKMLKLILKNIQEAAEVAININQVYILTPVDVRTNPGWFRLELIHSYHVQKSKYLCSVLPIHFLNTHWLAVVIQYNCEDNSKPNVYLFDPLGLNDDKVEALASIIKNTGKYTRPVMINLLPSNQSVIKNVYARHCVSWMLESIKIIIDGLFKKLERQEIEKSIKEVPPVLNKIHRQNQKRLESL